jgi:hypothetical protein
MAERAGLFEDDLDLSQFTPQKPSKPESSDIVRELAERANFQNSAPAKPQRKPDRRRRTGRNVQLNLKVTDGTRDLFYEVFDSYRAKDDRVTHGGVFEWAVRALIEKHPKV